MFKATTRHHDLPFASLVEESLRTILGKHHEHWYADYKLFLGLAIVFVILLESVVHFKLGPNKRAWFKCAEIFGIDLVFLHLMQYQERWLASCYGFSCCYLLFWTLHGVSSSKVKTSFSGVNVYLDMGATAFAKAFIVFCGQMCLTKFLVNATYHVAGAEISYLYWATAFVAVQNTAIFGRGSDSQVGSPFKASTWVTLLSNSPRIRLTKGKSDEPIHQPPHVMWARFFMDFIVNGVVRDAIAYTTPLLLMASENDMEFVQNALAVLFIPTLDDRSETQEYSVAVEEPSLRDEEVPLAFPEYRPECYSHA